MSATGSNVRVRRADAPGHRYDVHVDGVRVGWVVRLGNRWHGYTRVAGKLDGAKVAHETDRRFVAVDAIVTNVRHHQPQLIARLTEEDAPPMTTTTPKAWYNQVTRDWQLSLDGSIAADANWLADDHGNARHFITAEDAYRAVEVAR